MGLMKFVLAFLCFTAILQIVVAFLPVKENNTVINRPEMERYADSLLRAHWTEVCRDSMNKWDSINKIYER